MHYERPQYYAQTVNRHDGGRGRGQQALRHPIIRRGILISFSPATYTASILILEATSAYLQGVPVACHLDGTSAQPDALCAILFFDEQSYSDAVVLAVYPNGTQGIPTPTPGRLVFTTPYQHLNSVTISAGSTGTYTLVSGASGIPSGALGALFSLSFSSSSAGASLYIGPRGAGANLPKYQMIGNLPAGGATLSGSGLVQLDSSGRIDIKANGGNCTINLYTQGYVQ
ncbi:MAG: hypothetical protein IMW89_17855 [Ktedonobacteraceae bacterium]|nr:hypothetical protein [Ktedonobacteraceae bacterium]